MSHPDATRVAPLDDHDVDGASPPAYRSEAALARELAIDPRRLRVLREIGLTSPVNLAGRHVYDRTEARRCAVLLRLQRHGVGLDERGRLFGDERDG